MAFEGDIFIKDLDIQTEMLIEGNLWTLNCALFSSLTGDLHHGSSQYLMEGVRIAFVKYGYETELKIFQNPEYGDFLNRCLLEIGFFTRRGSSDKEYQTLDKKFLRFLPKIDEKFLKEEEIKEIKGYSIHYINYNLWKISMLFFILDFLTRSNTIMSRLEVDPIGTFMFDLFKKFKLFLEEKIKNYGGEDIDYQNTFQDFLNLPENLEERLRIESYHKAKLVSYLDIDSMIKIGENESIEFKEEVGNGKSLTKDAISFSNSGGGKILVGVKDSGELNEIKDIKTESRRIIDLLRSNINPQINPDIYTQRYKDFDIIIIEIFSSDKVVADNENNCFIRIGEESVKPSKGEYLKLLKNKGEIK
ncbi:MAG: ATP-binding protein [archaeon]